MLPGGRLTQVKPGVLVVAGRPPKLAICTVTLPPSITDVGSVALVVRVSATASSLAS